MRKELTDAAEGAEQFLLCKVRPLGRGGVKAKMNVLYFFLIFWGPSHKILKKYGAGLDSSLSPGL